MNRHGTSGHVATPTAMTIAVTISSASTRFTAYPPIQKSGSPRSRTKPHVGHAGLSAHQLRKTEPPPHRGQRSNRARPVRTRNLRAVTGSGRPTEGSGFRLQAPGKEKGSRLKVLPL